jgi:hypothetical protein
MEITGATESPSMVTKILRNLEVAGWIRKRVKRRVISREPEKKYRNTMVLSFAIATRWPFAHEALDSRRSRATHIIDQALLGEVYREICVRNEKGRVLRRKTRDRRLGFKQSLRNLSTWLFRSKGLDVPMPECVGSLFYLKWEKGLPNFRLQLLHDQSGGCHLLVEGRSGKDGAWSVIYSMPEIELLRPRDIAPADFEAALLRIFSGSEPPGNDVLPFVSEAKRIAGQAARPAQDLGRAATRSLSNNIHTWIPNLKRVGVPVLDRNVFGWPKTHPDFRIRNFSKGACNCLLVEKRVLDKWVGVYAIPDIQKCGDVTPEQFEDALEKILGEMVPGVDILPFEAQHAQPVQASAAVVVESPAFG